MTLRLIALMSVVLLLSLAAFGLSVNYYQDKLMDEVARTASDVGKATLRTLDPASGLHAPSFTAEGGEMFVWAAGYTRGADGAHETVRRRFVEGTGDAEAPFRVTEVTCSSVQAVEGAEGPECVTVDRVAASAAPLVVESDGEIPDGRNRFVIRIDEIRAETGDESEMILTIPRVDGTRLAAETRHYGYTQVLRHDAAPPAEATPAELLRLPISTRDYDKLFAEMRSRSLFLFLGVFVVGTVLSAGLATRFTRPIRKLDAGLRRISDGDLDVEVRAQGRDEMARLGSAFNEMTRRLRANRERARELVRREKLTAVGRLAAGVAHDVRNPLHSIGLTLSHLAESCRPDGRERGDEFDRSLEIIRGEIRRLDRLVANFLRFTASEGGERVEVDLADLLRETAQLVRKEAEWREVEVEVRIEAERTRLVGDGEALRASILNLVLNAFEAMQRGGRLELLLRDDEGVLAVEVADDGCGIPEEAREKVFEFGYTTRDNGSGLGLAMVHQTVVEDHGGRIRIDGRPGGGTVVRMDFAAEAA